MRAVAACLLAAVAIVSAAAMAPTEAVESVRDIPTYPVTINASSVVRSTFNGFGFSMVGGSLENETYAAAKEAILTNLVEDLNTQVVRLWWNEDFPRDPKWDAFFVENYIESGLVKDFEKHGVETLLLAPGGPKSTFVAQQAMDVANFIQELRNNGTRIGVTGIGNEPGAWNDTDVVEVVKVLSQNLTAMGLEDVKIIAPEWASQDGTGLARVEACKNDSACWDALHGIAGHSYNMAATDDWDATILAPGAAGPPSKAYWVTEAGNGGPWNVSGVVMAARMMNDLNHLVDTWVWFIGSEQHDPHSGQDEMRLIITWKNGTAPLASSWAEYKAALADPSAPWPLYTRTPTWYYAHQLNAIFRPGAQMRYCLANETFGAGGGPSMTWTFGKKEAFNMAVGQNTDGSWAIALANPTGLMPKDMYESFFPTSNFNVNIDVPALRGSGAITFDAVISIADTTLEQPADPVVLTDGRATVALPPNSLITLISKPSAQ